MKEIWILCADSESGDHYHATAHWDHEPTKEEINRELIELDAVEFEPDQDEGFNPVEVDGKKYECYVYPIIRKISV